MVDLENEGNMKLGSAKDRTECVADSLGDHLHLIPSGRTVVGTAVAGRVRIGPTDLRRAAGCVLCEREDAFHVEFIELPWVTVDPSDRELLAQFLGVPVVRLDVNRAFEQECFVQAIRSWEVPYAVRVTGRVTRLGTTLARKSEGSGIATVANRRDFEHDQAESRWSMMLDLRE